VRKALEPVGRVIPAVYNAVLASLSKLAARDTKHGPRLVLENLAALQPRMAALAARAPDIKGCRDDLQVRARRASMHAPALAATQRASCRLRRACMHCMCASAESLRLRMRRSHCVHAPRRSPCMHRRAHHGRPRVQGNLARARGKVVEEQLQASKLWPMLSFAGRLHVLLREVAPAEVQFQVRPSTASGCTCRNASIVCLHSMPVPARMRLRQPVRTSACCALCSITLRPPRRTVRRCRGSSARPSARGVHAAHARARACSKATRRSICQATRRC
jgi:hypothetical protein